MVVLPGLGANDRSTIAIRGFLETLGYQVHGWGGGRNVRASAADLSAVASQVGKLRQDSGRRVCLVGWSRGGIIAREVPRQVPDNARMVITLGSPIAALGATNVSAIWRLLTGER